MKNEKKYPTPKEFLIELPLYEVIYFEDDDLEEGWKLYYFDERIDSYCPECNQHSIFSKSGSKARDIVDYMSNSWVNKGVFNIELECSRNPQHKLYFIFNVEEQTIQKIGQLPSIASLNLFDVKKYSKVLDFKYFKELTKAIGLVSHGIGVGSFVYLRRIFEFLIEEAHAKQSSSEAWDEEKFNQARMAEKIKILESELPSFLVENKSMYSILSKGIHELTEDECLESFPVLKVGIEIILDEKLEKMNKEKKLEEAKKAMVKLNSQI